MRIPVFVSIMTMAFLPSVTSAQAVTESWLSQAGISCGGGLTVELQGEIDAAVLRRLKIASIEGDGKYQRSETETLLNQFKDEEKRDTYVDYVNCLLQVMSLATTTSNLPPREVVLDSAIAVAPLETIKRGQRFVMEPGDTIAVMNHSMLFTVDGAEDYQKRNIVYYSWSNSETGESESKSYTYQSQLIKLGEECSLTPYKIDVEGLQVSFLSNC